VLLSLEVRTNATNGFCFGRYLGRFLEREEGISLVALHSKDVRADHAAVTARGIQSQGFIDFRRPMTKPDGSPDTVVVSLRCSLMKLSRRVAFHLSPASVLN